VVAHAKACLYINAARGVIQDAVCASTDWPSLLRGLRYCINGIPLKVEPQEQRTSIAERT